MTWFKIDDGSAFNAKVLAAGNEAWGAFCRVGAVCSQQLTDGYFSRALALTIAPKRVWDRLIEVELVDALDKGEMRIHDYLQRNPSKEQVLRERALAAARMTRVRSAIVRPNMPPNGGGTNGPTSPSPSRPVPNTNSVSRRLVTHDANGERPDDDELSTGGVPNETWDAYAELKLRQQGNVKNPGPWKRSTATNARTELGEQAQRWWHDYVLTPRRLAECLLDGQIRNVQRRTT